MPGAKRVLHSVACNKQVFTWSQKGAMWYQEEVHMVPGGVKWSQVDVVQSHECVTWFQECHIFPGECHMVPRGCHMVKGICYNMSQEGVT